MSTTTLTEKQKAALNGLNATPGLIPIIHFGKMAPLGLVEKTGEPGARGYAHARITDAGRAAL